MKNKRLHRRAAFTLVEMLLVLVIIAVLAAVVIPKLAGRSQQAKVTAAQAQIGAFKTALDAFEVDNGAYPKSLDALINNPGNSQSWRGPYLDKIPADPWSGNYVYTYPGKLHAGSYDITSAGPDGRVGGDDDVTN